MVLSDESYRGVPSGFKVFAKKLSAKLLCKLFKRAISVSLIGLGVGKAYYLNNNSEGFNSIIGKGCDCKSQNSIMFNNYRY
jgi:hypothetical protein